MPLGESIEQAVEAERRLSVELGNFIGRWVAVFDHEVVADAATLDEILDATKVMEIDAVFQVNDTPSFF